MPARTVNLTYWPPDNHLESLFVDGRGALNVVWKVQNGPWQGPVGLTAAGLAPPGAPVALVAYPLQNQFEALQVDNRGAVNVVWKVGNAAWQGPVGLTPAGFAPPAANIAAVYYEPYDQLEAFVVDAHGVLCVVWKRDNGNWQVAGLTRPNFAPPGAHVAVSPFPIDNQLFLCVVDGAGAVQCLCKSNNGLWSQPFVLPGRAPPGAALAALTDPSGDQLVVCYVDTSGATSAILMAPGGAWQGPTLLSVPGASPPGASIAAVSYALNAQLEVFVVDSAGCVSVAWRPPGSNWNPPAALTTRGFAEPGAPLAVANYPVQDQLELVTTSAAGVLSLIWKVENSYWWPCPVPLEPLPPPAGGEPISVVETVRLGQLTGNVAPASLPLLNLTTAWGVPGVDLGANTEHSDGNLSRLFIFFGDVPRAGRIDGPPQDADLVAWTEDRHTQPGGFTLQPVMAGSHFDPFTVAGPIGHTLTNETPTGAFSFGGRVYVFIFVLNDRGDVHHPGVASYLVSKEDPRQPGPFLEEFLFARNRFWQVAPTVVQRADHAWLPHDGYGQGVVLFGHGANPAVGTDAIHLAWLPLGPNGPVLADARYFTGNADNPWTTQIDDAGPLITLRPGYTSVSATWLAESGQWVLLYSTANGRDTVLGSIVARLGATPFELSGNVEVFAPCRDRAYTHYLHWPGFDDLFPFVGPDLGDAPAWPYGAFILPRFTRWSAQARTLDLTYLLSPNRPYQVQVMRTTLHIN
jgi:hypothetical protein